MEQERIERFHPLGDRVLVRAQECKTFELDGVIIRPGHRQGFFTRARVLRIGPGDDAQRLVKVGEEVELRHYGVKEGRGVPRIGHDLFVVPIGDIVGVFE